MLTPVQAKKLQTLYYYQGLEHVRVIHKEYGEGRVEGISGDGYLYAVFSSDVKSSIFFDDENLNFPDLN
ncbi:hypothetical protein ACFFHF_09905 [Robertmurraya beringensis]|uniref:Uncharacterized protein n=1 Tax=Robertmurraya beringensis TaxID=641660 RepID=A0ABV6KRC2_9BACI